MSSTREKMRSIVVLAALTGLVAACSEKTTAEQPGGDPAAKESVAFEWSEAPTLDQIPAAAVKGEANGKPFAAKAIYFEPRFRSWTMVIHEAELSRPTGIRPQGQYISISLPEAPAAGMKWTKALKYGDGFFQIQKADGTGLTSWNSQNAYAIEITKWDVKPYDEKRMFQVAGKASGRIAICYKGTGDLKNAWAAGTFEDVLVRYMGKPYWLRKPAGS